jgi:hypothetical protein
MLRSSHKLKLQLQLPKKPFVMLSSTDRGRLQHKLRTMVQFPLLRPSHLPAVHSLLRQLLSRYKREK